MEAGVPPKQPCTYIVQAQIFRNEEILASQLATSGDIMI